MAGERITEQASHYDNLENMPVERLLEAMNAEDRTVPEAVGRVIPELASLVEEIVGRMGAGGRLFYIGAGTSGRLGVVDASEVPPTFGVPDSRVIGIIAGGDGAIRKAVENAEDNPEQGWADIRAFSPTENDTVLGIAASGTTPYVIGAVTQARRAGLLTACICCNPDSPLSRAVEHPIVAVTGPEFVTGSTRMKAGTATKLILNMISTSVMIRLGHVRGNRMVDMQLTNGKLVERGARMIMAETGLEDYAEARELLLRSGSVRKAVETVGGSNPPYAGRTELPAGRVHRLCSPSGPEAELDAD